MSRAPRPPVLDPSRGGTPLVEPETPPVLPPTYAARPFYGTPFVASPPASKRAPRRWSGLLVALVVIGAAGGAAYKWGYPALFPKNDSAPTTVGDGTLPDQEFAPAPLESASWTEAITNLVIDDAGVASRETVSLAYDANFGQRSSRVVATGPSGETTTELRSGDYVYRPGAAHGATWTRQLQTPRPGVIHTNDPRTIKMYQDVVTPAMRAAATDVVVASSPEGGATFTIYSFRIDLRSVIPGWDELPFTVADEAAYIGNGVVTIDEAGVVRRFEIAADEAALARSMVLTPGSALAVKLTGEILATPSFYVPESPFSVVDIPPAEPATPVAPGESEECYGDRRTMEVATQAWITNNPGQYPTEVELVTDGFLRFESDTYDTANGAAIPAPGGPCAFADPAG